MQRILVVDDDPSIRRLYELELRDAGYAVTVAGDLESAEELVAAWQPHAVILDVRLGRDNGLDLLRRIAGGDIRTVLVSGYSGYRDDFTTWLADAFLMKSVDVAALVRTVDELLAVPLCEPA